MELLKDLEIVLLLTTNKVSFSSLYEIAHSIWWDIQLGHVIKKSVNFKISTIVKRHTGVDEAPKSYSLLQGLFTLPVSIFAP